MSLVEQIITICTSPANQTLCSPWPPAVAVRLFFCGVPATEEDAAGLLASGLAGKLYEAGILLHSPPSVWTFPFHLRIVLGLYLFSDHLG